MQCPAEFYLDRSTAFGYDKQKSYINVSHCCKGGVPGVPTYFRMMEVLSCSMMDFLPYILLVVYPFRNRTRLKSFLAGLLTLVITPALLYYDISSALLGTVPVPLPYPLMRSAVLLVFAFLVIHVHPGKMLLNTCNVINLSLLISSLADRFAADYTVKHLLVTVLLQTVLLIPYTLLLVYVLAPTLSESKALPWKLLFVVPAAGTAIGCMMLLSGSSSLVVTMLTALIAASVVSVLTVILTKTEVITLFRKKNRASACEAEAPVMTAEPTRDAAQEYLTCLHKRMADAEFSYKELLLQVMTMEDDLGNGDLEQLRSKLNTMRKQLAPEINPTGNSQVDAVVTYYTRQAMLSNAKLASNLSLPEITSVSDEDITVLIGCLLETAISACREQTAGARRIACATHQDEDLLQIGVKYTYASPTDPDSELLNICRSIAQSHDGKLAVIDMQGVTQIVATLHI